MTAAVQPWIPLIGWLRIARNSPASYQQMAAARLDTASTSAERCLLHAVLARSALELLDGRRAIDHARRAVALDDEAIDAFARAEVHGVLVEAAILTGDVPGALAALAAGERAVGEPASVLLQLQRCHLHYKLGELDLALIAIDRAVTSIPEDRPDDRARALNNRGVLRLYLGGARAGLADLEAAEHAFDRAGRGLDAADALTNKGMMLARLGDLPGALRAFGEAERRLTDLGEPTDQHRVYQAETLVLSGLAEEVCESLPAAIERLEQAGMLADAAEARLYLSMAKLLVGSPDAASDAAQTAAALRAARRAGWAAIAEDVALQARLERDGPAAVDPHSAQVVAAELDRVGMRSFAPASWLRAARVAIAGGRPQDALAAYARLAGRRDTLPARATACEAEARGALLVGNHRAAERSAKRGLRLVERNRSLFEATELRVQASGWGEGLAEVLISVAIDDGTPRDLLAAAERWRATATISRPPLPPPDERLAGLLADYRGLLAPFDPADGPGAADRAGARLREAERAVAEELRRRTSRAEHHRRVLDLDELLDEIGDRTLVEFVAHHGELEAVIATGGTVRRVALGERAGMERVADRVHEGLQALAPVAGHAAGPLVARGLRPVLDRLGELLAPVTRDVPGDELIVVPTAGLEHVPWTALARRPVTLTPSAQIWLNAARRPPTAVIGDRAVAFAGPGLPGAHAEAEAVARIHRHGFLVSGTAATAARLIAEAERAALVHVACHARFRATNPLFSHLLLDDGAVTGFDLERLQHAPQAMVLSACSSGRLGPRAGGELTGLASVLLGAGVGALVTSVLSLPDSAAVEALCQLHTRLATGRPVARALAEVVASQPTDDPLGLVLSCALACYGRGDWRLTPGGRTTG